MNQGDFLAGLFSYETESLSQTWCTADSRIHTNTLVQNICMACVTADSHSCGWLNFLFTLIG